MKRLITVMLLLAVCATVFAGGRPGRARAVQKEKLLGLISEYRQTDGFDVVNIGALGTSLARSVAKIAVKVEGNDELAEMLRLANGVRRFCIVDYEDCSPRVRDSFNSKLSRILSKSELLVKVNDSEDDDVCMYGVVNEDASKIKDFVISVPNDCALICLFGTISMDAVGKVVEHMQ